MTKPIARPDRRTPSRPLVEVTATGIAGRFRPEGAVTQLVALVDGVPRGVAETVPVGDGSERRFELALPAHLLGGSLDLVAAETGRSVLAGEIDLGPARGLRWEGWTLRGRRLRGSFRFEGPAAPRDGLAVPVEFRAGDALFGAAYALPDADGAYRFAGEVNRLPPPDKPAEITPVVGGIPVQDRLPIECAQFGFAGAVETSDVPRAQGWVLDLHEPLRRVRVELRVNGRQVATALADRLRPDLRDAGLGDGRSGFAIPFPRTVPLDRDLRIEVVVAGTGLNLANSPYRRPASPPYLGFFDALEGPFARGWIVNMHQPGRPVQVEAVCNGEVIGSELANLHRGDVGKAGLPTTRCGFRLLLERPLAELIGHDIHLRVAGSEQVLAGSPRQLSQNDNITRFMLRGRMPAPTLRRLSRLLTRRTRAVGISIIMPVFDPPREWLVEALGSVQAQWSGNWELICIDDGSREPHVREVLDRFAGRDGRIRVLRSPENLGIARSINLGLRAARGTYVAFMDHDDVIEPDAVYKLAMAALETGAELIYSDEVLTTESIDAVVEVRARPAFSHDFYLSHPYFVHMIAVRAALARELAGWDESLPISADVDFVLRVIERARVVAHVPSVLYRWRTHGGSAGHARRAQVTRATKAALERHLDRLRLPATVGDGTGFNEYRIDWPDDGGEVLIVIPTRNRGDLLRACIDSIERTAAGANYRILVIDHHSTDRKTVQYLESLAGRHQVMPYAGRFNYARMNNQAVRAHAGDARYLLFLNNDVEAIEPGWLPRLRSLAGRREVGAVGPLLLYGDGRVQHAGVLVGFAEAADHAMKFARAWLRRGQRHPGYNCNLTSVRDYSAVTAACMMVRREVFQQVNGFNESFAVGFNDTDLCLRMRDAGYKVLYDGHTALYHHESLTRTETREVHHPEDDARLRARWRRFFDRGDPFYSPLLSPNGTDHSLRTDAGCKGRMQVRAVQLDWTRPPAPAPRRRPARAKT